MGSNTEHYSLNLFDGSDKLSRTKFNENFSTIDEALNENKVIIRTTAPMTATVGVVGQFYLDTVAKKLYQCVQNVGDSAFTWKLIPADKIGDIKVTARTDLGNNWALCNGAVLSLIDYSEIASVISRRAPVSFTNTESLTTNCPTCPLVYGGGCYVGVYNSTLYYSTDKNGPFLTKSFTGTAISTSLKFGEDYFCFYAGSGANCYLYTFNPSTLSVSQYLINSDSSLTGEQTIIHMGGDVFVHMGRKGGYYSCVVAFIWAKSGSTKSVFEFQYTYAKIHVSGSNVVTVIGRPYDGSTAYAYGYSYTINESTITISDIIYLDFNAWKTSTEGGRRWSIGGGKYISIYSTVVLIITETSTTSTSYNLPSVAGTILRDGWLSSDLKYYYFICYNSSTATYALYAFDVVNREFCLVNTFPFNANERVIRNDNAIHFYTSTGLLLYERAASEGVLLPTISTDKCYNYIKVKEE